MKKAFLFVTKWMLALVAGIGMLLGAIALDWSDGACFSVYFFGSLFAALVLGVFDGAEQSKHKASRYDSIRHKTGSYGHAAVFIGTACLLIGTPQECDDLCDDLWHYGQQARMEMLTGEETTFEIL